MLRPSLVTVLTLILSSSAANAETIAGRASVIDADTLDVHGSRVRILDIDAPESRQPCTRHDGSEWRCGQQAALALADWIGARPVICETTRKDRYKRWLAHCAVGGEDVALWLASQGWVFAYRDCRCETVRDAVEKARTAGLGIWSGSIAEPWEWRKAQ